MSAGICIMNRNAIAMAADSAVTVGDHAAIHNSANKLFSLSKVAPVGVIIYANGTFMNIPVEIMIKEYKKRIGRKTFKTLKDYFSSFIAFLESNKDLFRFDINEEIYVKTVFYNIMGGLRGDYLAILEDKKKSKGADLIKEEIETVAQEAINNTINTINSLEQLETACFYDYIKTKYKDWFYTFIKKEKDFSWITEEQAVLFSEKVCEIYDKRFDRNGYVGFAIAGYGEHEIYPNLVHAHLSGYINGKVRYYIVQEVSIDENTSASVVPLAQVDVMQTFLFGINDSFLGYLAEEIPIQITHSLNTIDDHLFSTGKKAVVLKQLVGVTDSIIQHMSDAAVKNYMAPILDSVATLPIEELGLLAESMINITSIRRKVALDSNIGTVGGPIDVSIVSKGDGFIWLKRKHYFEKKYNPQFFFSHYDSNGQGDDLNDE